MRDSLPEYRGYRRPMDVLRVFLALFTIVGIAYLVDIPRGDTSAEAVRQARSEGNFSGRAASAARLEESARHAALSGNPPPRVPQTFADCEATLREAGVDYRKLGGAATRGIAWPIRLIGPLSGVQIEGAAKPDAETNFLDCRLATTLLAWAPTLRAHGIIAIQHYSMYRQDARVGDSDRPSGHASGRAIDVGRLELQDGSWISVVDDWKNRTPNADPCGKWRDEPAGKLLRELVCDAAARGLFQTIVTPHHNEAHANHVHLEVDPSAGGLWIH